MPSADEFNRAAILIALAYAPPIGECNECGWPHVIGYCCSCGCTDPGENEIDVVSLAKDFVR